MAEERLRHGVKVLVCGKDSNGVIRPFLVDETGKLVLTS